MPAPRPALARRRPHALAVAAGALAATGCLPRFHTPPIPAPTPSELRILAQEVGPEQPVPLRVASDPVLETVTVLVGPLTLAPGGAHPDATGGMDDADHALTRLRFEWPVGGWIRGYEAQLFDRSGAPVDPALIHHLVVMNFDRRQFAYPTAEKLMAVGRETGDVQLPVSIGVPMSPGYRLGLNAAWHNESDADVEVFLRVIFRWTPDDGRREPRAVLPVNLDVNNLPGESSAYDLPAGPSRRAFEFEVPLDGKLLAVSGHLHQHGRRVRLEEAEGSRRVVEVEAEYDAQGRLTGVQQRRILGFLGRGVRLNGGRLYRLIGEYRNPEGRTLTDGAMAQMIAVYAPDRWEEWPELDPTHPDYVVDVASWRLDLDARAFNARVAHSAHGEHGGNAEAGASAEPPPAGGAPAPRGR